MELSSMGNTNLGKNKPMERGWAGRAPRDLLDASTVRSGKTKNGPAAPWGVLGKASGSGGGLSPSFSPGDTSRVLSMGQDRRHGPKDRSWESSSAWKRLRKDLINAQES